MTGTPAYSPKTLAIAIADAMDARGVSVEYLAQQIGHSSPRALISMLNGRMKFHLNLLKPISSALDLEPGALLELALREYMPDIWPELEAGFGLVPLTEAEQNVIREIRSVVGNNPDRMTVIGPDRVISVVFS